MAAGSGVMWTESRVGFWEGGGGERECEMQEGDAG
jgi:hypothetical protein